MADDLKLARPYLLLLALATVGRWLLGSFGVPYEKGTGTLSIVTLTLYASAFYGAFCRRWCGYGPEQAARLGLTLGLMSQVVILLATLLSYALGIQTYFNHPLALELQGPEASLGDALVSRGAGFIATPILAGIIGSVGWALGGLLPKSDGRSGSVHEGRPE